MAWLKDGQRVIRHLKAHKSKKYQVPADYAYEFRLALTTFHHQRVWSPRARAVVPLTPLPPAPPPVATSPPGAKPPGATGVAAGARPAVPSPPACTATEVPLGGATSAAYPPRPPLWGPWKRAKMSAEERSTYPSPSP